MTLSPILIHGQIKKTTYRQCYCVCCVGVCRLLVSVNDINLLLHSISMHFILSYGAAYTFFDLNTRHLFVSRFEKENSSMRSWLDRCESVCCPDNDLLSADKVKIRNELQNVQVNPFGTRI